MWKVAEKHPANGGTDAEIFKEKIFTNTFLVKEWASISIIISRYIISDFEIFL
jgi:hypothetical protein